ncbi:MAG TPA: GTP-binding protein, partial [Acidimicrobiia bacterium]|nr:GTP-binding protein [Acidimicrobiia bacterium]
VVSAVDAAIIVLDAAKGIEAQTLKLFQVAQARGIPLITFINKCDRPGLAPLELIDDIERQLGIRAMPVTWPIGMGGDFVGVADRRDGSFWAFDRTAHGAGIAAERQTSLKDLADGEHRSKARIELELLEAVGADYDHKAFLAGEATPVLFGSALWNFGIRLLLDAVVDLGPPPEPRPDKSGLALALDGQCSGFVFKIQTNLDPRHRDRVAYLRVCSGEFERGMTLVNQRTGRVFSTKYAHQMFGRARDAIEVAGPGDVVGLVNAGDVQIGDSLSEDGAVAYPPIPSFAPEHFKIARNIDTARYKQFRRGITRLDQEGVVQVLRHPDRGDQQPVFAAVGPMQFEVAIHRLEHEYGARVELTPSQFTVARRTDPGSAVELNQIRDVDVFARADGTLIALFPHRHRLDAVIRDHPELTLDSIVVG